LPNRILPSLRRVFPFAAFGHCIAPKNKLKTHSLVSTFWGQAQRELN
jgi:hypothetical protein